MPTGVVLSGRMSLGGDYTYSVPFRATAPATTCRQYAMPGDGSFATPTVEVNTPRPLFLRAQLAAGYHGPGTYAGGIGVPLGGDAAVSIPTAEGYAIQPYRSTDASPMALTVRANGSGSFTFQRWRTDEIRGVTSNTIAGHLDGVVTWTCAAG